SPPGTAPYFGLAWMLRENGLTIRDVTVVNLEPGPARAKPATTATPASSRRAKDRGDILILLWWRSRSSRLCGQSSG
ncbi:hypothetical protein, partial [Stenotrophomonas maltophilia]|uniref:hypothetical protein n=1 Tax=Stenotrophomonas maltophilia TaxID=40324 RepID=UPI0023B79087